MINFHLGEIELSTAKASKAASLLNSESTQIFHSLLIDRILELRLNAGPTEQGALLAFQALQTVLGHSPQSWNRVLNYCVRNAKRIAEDARQLRDLMKDLRKLEPGSKDYEKALRQLRKAPSRFVWPIRGNLGELFLSHWPQWRRELSKLLQEAENIAEREMGSPGWEAVPFSGNVRLGGKMTWDEGILLINRTKKPPRFALHTAAQVKIQRRVKGVDQIIADRSAEIGKSAKVPELELLTNGTSEVFVYEKLPEHVSTHRYLFYPEEGKITAADIEKLKANKMQAQAVAMDISADDLEALAHQFMYAVEDLISRSL